MMKMKQESERASLRLNIKKSKIMVSSPITAWKIDGENVEVVTEFLFLGAKITADGDCSHEIRRRLLLHRKAMRNLYVGQEATVRTLYGTTDWFKIEKGVQQGCLLSPCLFNLYTERIMRNAGLDELEAGIKTGGRNINNLRYADERK